MAKELDGAPFILTRKGSPDYIVRTHNGGNMDDIQEKTCTPRAETAQNSHNCQCAENVSACNNEEKSPAPTGGRPETIRAETIARSKVRLDSADPVGDMAAALSKVVEEKITVADKHIFNPMPKKRAYGSKQFSGCLECGAMFGHRATCSKG